MRMITRTTAIGLVLLATACGGGASGPDLGSVAPCDLLTPAQRSDAGLDVGRPADTGPLRSCTWMPEGAGFGVPVILGVLPGSELGEARTVSPRAEVTETEVGGFPALQMTGEVCMTAVDVGSGLLSLTGECGRQELIELAVANLAA